MRRGEVRCTTTPELCLTDRSIVAGSIPGLHVACHKWPKSSRLDSLSLSPRPLDSSLLNQFKRGFVQASLEIPEMPSLPSGDAVVDFFRRLYEAIVQFSVQTATHATQFAKEHPEDGKTIGMLVVAAAVCIWIVFPVLRSIIIAIGKCVYALGELLLQGSAAARVQRAAYGGGTTGVFSKLQSRGATGR
ncbi:hypothetical protein BD311DRAFT_471609 [Dichomitus squalens]|uniref:Uncharacterized protein n=1 Tax=Dichomitus squalens TaxID=114155 RepID=A0A4V2JZP7_9APHY|nr:hypothetical protein BD311DRAFT_471609 [Dichomitus squalens]